MCRRTFVRPFAVAVALALLPIAALHAADPAESTFRVFLLNGIALPSYGEPVQVDDRMVFNLLVRADATRPVLQLMSLPVSTIDLLKTTAYADALHAAAYARTRGELDYQALVSDTARVMGSLSQVDDPNRRVEIAQAGRAEVMAWPKTHHGYRERDVLALADLFDDAIAGARAAAGASSFSFDLVARTAGPNLSLIQPLPDIRESASLALAAAAVEDRADERSAVLAAVASATTGDAALADLGGVAQARLAGEARVDQAYAALATSIHARLDAAVGRGDVTVVKAAAADLSAGDRALGASRSDVVSTLASDIETALRTARTYRAVLDHYVDVRQSLLAYERAVRPAFAALARTTRVLEAIRNGHAVSVDDLIAAMARLSKAQTTLAGIAPPEDLANVHATIVSTVQMAREACDRRRQAAVTGASATSLEASSAAAGALLLAGRAHDDLVTGLYPPAHP